MEPGLHGCGLQSPRCRTPRWRHVRCHGGHGPEEWGFDRSYGLYTGGANHWNQNPFHVNTRDPQVVEQLKRGEMPLEPYHENGKLVKRPIGVYSDALWTSKLMEYLEEGRQAGKPFFAYVAYTTAHVPLQAPDFQLEDMDGEKHSLESYRGKVVILNFWATWCPPCRREIPSMEALHQAFRDEAFAILAINEWETEDHVFAFMGQLPVEPSFPILLDLDSEVATSFGVSTRPSRFGSSPRATSIWWTASSIFGISTFF